MYNYDGEESVKVFEIDEFETVVAKHIDEARAFLVSTLGENYTLGDDIEIREIPADEQIVLYDLEVVPPAEICKTASEWCDLVPNGTTLPFILSEPFESKQSK